MTFPRSGGGSGRLGRLAGRSVIAVPLLFGTLAGCHRTAAPALPGGATLKVEMGKSAKLDPDAALRCFVHGQFVGMQTPGACAEKNGVAPGALDVGLDQSGALAAGAKDTPLQPLSNATEDNATGDDDAAGADADSSPAPVTQAAAPQDQAGAAGCLRFSRSGWRDAGRGVTLNACVHALFDGHCVAPGDAVYGRWGAQTLRLAAGRVGISPDNRNFHPLMRQDPDDCSILDD